MKLEKYLPFALILFLLAGSDPNCVAQNATGALRGEVADPSGAAIPGASVIMTPSTGVPIVVKSDGQGNYEFKNLLHEK
jgi:hypothetical protein